MQEVDLSRIVRWIALNEVSPSIFRGGSARLAKLLPVLHHSMYRAAEEQHFPLQLLQQDLQLAFSTNALKNGNAPKNGTAKAEPLILSDEHILQLLENTKIKHRACVSLMAPTVLPSTADFVDAAL